MLMLTNNTPIMLNKYKKNPMENALIKVPTTANNKTLPKLPKKSRSYNE